MAGIADFLDSLIGGFDLICFALAIGSLFWGLFVLRPWNNGDGYNAVLLQRTITLLYKGGFWLAAAQIFKIILKIWLMAAVLERWPFPEFASTTQFIGGLVRAVLTVFLAGYCYQYLSKNPFSKRHWITASIVALPMIISGAWLVHGAGRFENQFILMSLTVVHQLAAAAWIGGVFQLVNIWLLRSSKQVPAELWPVLLKRFSTFGIASVAMILISGLPIALQYIDTWNGLIGTGYGNLLMVKITLMAIALGFAWLNRSAILAFGFSGDHHALNNRVPYYIEAETFVLVTLLFTAASLASQPPAIDIPTLTASWQEVLNTFNPQIPQTSSPTHTDLIAGEAGRVAIVGQVPSLAATEWSNYNHNISGIFLTVMSFFAMLSYVNKSGFERLKYWPLGFVGLGIFLFFRSDAETWPLGPIGFWESTFNNGEVLQHRIATLLVFVLGIMELSARITKTPDSKLPFVFPLLAAFGGLMLLTHSHVGFQPKSAFLIQVGHTMMGIFSLILATGRWLELKLDRPGKEIAGFISVAAMFQIGLILMFYREPLY
ncbi:MAG: CopD family protein [Methylobacter tundripaludum]|uniref:Copper resistance protein D n=1 Tax=Methylobacter tundripaludum TaxID=173365 RepID=A0A2S6GZV6_9GAMM|nr:CopD family protein [Methylobacter tundripaludum]MCK9634750.1 CopD family protein [Methylobacter tundripaludum]PPK70706.1 putative copper resistance protein D [Methylobacter tundripaludum]